MVDNIINSHKSIIFLDGNMLDKKIVKLLNTKLPLIAADGASQKFISLDLIPDYIIGDDDSNFFTNRKTKFYKDFDQNTTDFEKCLTFVKNKNLSPSLVLGINGGEIDHILGNFQAMIKHAKNLPLYFLDTYKTKKKSLGIKLGIPLIDTLQLRLKNKATLSILPYPSCIVSSKGLKWELNDTLLHVDGILGIRNETISQSVHLQISKGKAMAIINCDYRTVS